ncbi:MAG: ASPIC/UnbV domain-containing protein, partial [Planctomycetaceae bacterium]
KVTVRSSSGTQVQFHDGQSGYLSQSSHPLHFGFEAGATIEEIRVSWPTGREQVLSGPQVLNQRLLIEEPAE